MLKHFALLDEASRAGMTKTAELLERAELSVPTVVERRGVTDRGEIESFDRAIADLLEEP